MAKLVSAANGVLVDDFKYFWLDNQARVNVEVFAKGLTIDWITDPRYWTYITETIPNTEYTVEVAKLIRVSWLNVMGEFDVRKLTMGTEYEIFFDIELTESASGWHLPVNFEHNIPPAGNTNSIQLNLEHLIGKGRTKIPIGKFTLECIPEGQGSPNGTFTMYERGGHWKSGLIVYGVAIKATN